MQNGEATSDRRAGPSRLSRWSARRVAMLWILWPTAILALVVVAALLSRHIYGDFSEVRLDLRRGNLIGLVATAIAPPLCLTILWWRMHGRRRRG